MRRMELPVGHGPQPVGHGSWPEPPGGRRRSTARRTVASDCGRHTEREEGQQRDEGSTTAVVMAIDLRSDTVTHPTQAMREAMYRAEVGDDVYGEDPTVNALEALAAEMTGKEAAVLVATGTMGNLVCTTTHCRHGDEVILGRTCHIFQNEVGGVAALGGMLTQTLPDDPGYMDPAEVDQAIRPATMHTPGAQLICVEQTHNRAGGAVVPLDILRRLRTIADAHGLLVHMDGARLFNAAVALGVPATEITRFTDSLSFCLSKGLSAPVGSVVCGTSDFVERARRKRKIYGGGMRQAGVFAAAGIVSLRSMIDRLADDHANARRLAEGLATMPGTLFDPATVQTNIVICRFTDEVGPAAALPERFAAEGVLAGHNGGDRIRFVTHHGIELADIDRALDGIRRALGTRRVAVGAPTAAY